jgi:hypothetical protein
MAITSEGTSQSFSYTGDIQTFTVPFTGLYKLEVWGGQGGGAVGGAGGHSVGYCILEKGNTVYICCGQSGSTVSTKGQTAPSTYNGGGSSKAQYQNWISSSGGGATHMAFIGGTLASIGKESFDENGLIVAGGGGGSGEPNAGAGNNSGGTGGGLEGGSYVNNMGATQTSAKGGGSFGQGGNSTNHGGAGGGGYYGGGANYNQYGGGGGSGWIGGVPELTFKGTIYSPSTSNGVNSGNGKATITLEKTGGFPTVYFNGTLLNGITFDGVEIDTVIFNGTTLS